MGSTPTTTPVLLVLAGPAGSGKSTLCERLVCETGVFSRVVTATTRPPRPGEVDGVHYHFLSPAQFDQLIAEGAFLEWAWVHGKHRYGTLSRAVTEPLSKGHSLVINIDVQGVASFRRAAASNPLLARYMTTVYIDVPEDVLRARLAGRGTDSAEEIERRMRTALMEAREKDSFDHLIISGDREVDYAALREVWRLAMEKSAR